MDCPYCGGRIEIDKWKIWEGEGFCKECEIGFYITIEVMKEGD